MLKKFFEGLVFGTGFGLALFIIGLVTAKVFFTPVIYTPETDSSTIRESFKDKGDTGPSALPKSLRFQPPGKLFYEMPIEERIEKSSVIALARYEPAPDGRMRAIIKEFLKKEPGTEIYYDIGDEYANSSYYPKDDTHYGDGVIIFFTDSPAQMRMSMTYSGDRIHSLADMPIELLRNKCESSGDS